MLLLLGIVAFMGIVATSVTDSIKENMGFDVILQEGSTDTDVNKLKQQWTRAEYISNLKYISSEDALRQWENETGEDLIELLGVNPFCPEFEIKVKSDYANLDSINKIITSIKDNTSISEINIHTEMVESINSNIRSIALILIIIAAALTLISFVLINNTVRLTVYSRRFIIHTMKLVGATAGFIRRPFIINNIIHGIIAAIIAIILLTGLLYYIRSLDQSIISAISWTAASYVYICLTIFGVMICALAALMATNKYLRIDYDDMFK